MKKVKVIQQIMSPGYGGVSTEFNALKKSQLNAEFEFVPLILEKPHRGINLHDILFYYHRIKEEKPDIIQIRGAAVDGLNAEIAAKIAGNSKILVCVHGMYSDFVYYNLLKKLIARFIVEPLCFKLADGISCVYRECSKRNNFKNYKNKMLPFVYNRIPTYDSVNYNETRKAVRQRYGIPKNATLGIYCGRVTKEKGLNYLLEALISLSQAWDNNQHIIIVGDGDYMYDFKNELSDNTVLKKMIHFTGVQKDVSSILAASDYFLMPSLHENLSIALLEAVAMKLPCIATNVGGNTEIVNSKIGIIIEKKNINQLANAIKMMWSKETRDYFVKNLNNEDFSKFSDKNVDQQLRDVYTQLLER